MTNTQTTAPAMHHACRWCRNHGRTYCACASCQRVVSCPDCGPNWALASMTALWDGTSLDSEFRHIDRDAMARHRDVEKIIREAREERYRLFESDGSALTRELNDDEAYDLAERDGLDCVAVWR